MFTRADLRVVVPHDNDLVVISVVKAGRRVPRVLVDQGSSTDVMFWTTFNKLQLSPDLLRPMRIKYRRLLLMEEEDIHLHI